MAIKWDRVFIELLSVAMRGQAGKAAEGSGELRDGDNLTISLITAVTYDDVKDEVFALL